MEDSPSVMGPHHAKAGNDSSDLAHRCVNLEGAVEHSSQTQNRQQHPYIHLVLATLAMPSQKPKVSKALCDRFSVAGLLRRYLFLLVHSNNAIVRPQVLQ